MKKLFVVWAKCPTCGEVLCCQIWFCTHYYPVEKYCSMYECKKGHNFTISTYKKIPDEKEKT